MGKASKQKGRRGEIEVRDLLKKMTGIEYMRTPMSGGYHLDFPWDVMKRPGQPDSPFDGHGIEVKNTASLRIPDWIKQCEEAERDATGFNPRKWYLFFKQSAKWYAVVPVENLERLIKESHEHGEG